MAIQYQHPLDRTFHALGDGSRRRMLSMLAAQGECTAGELAVPFGYAQPTISKHIKVLEKAGLVHRVVDGRVHRFSLMPQPLDDAADWIKHHRMFWENTLVRLEEFVLDDNNETAGS